MDERKLRAIKVFAIIYIVFGLAMIYLLNFNTGIEISGNPNSGSGLEIKVKNSSLHMIQDVNVSIIDANNSRSIILSIAEFRPSEEKTVKIPEIHSVNGTITISAKAAYHLEVVKKIQAEGTQEAKNELSTVLEGPSKTFTNTPTKFAIKACQTENETQAVKITPVLESKYFPINAEERSFEIKGSQCRTEEFKFTPVNTGKTTIAFNIQIGSVNKRLEKEIEIIE